MLVETSAILWQLLILWKELGADVSVWLMAFQRLGSLPATVFVSDAHKVPNWQVGQPCLLLPDECFKARQWDCSRYMSKGDKAEFENNFARHNEH